MPFKATATVAFVLLAGVATPLASQTSNDPNTARLVTSDITNFWRAYDRAQLATTDEARAAAYYDLYVRPASPGLHDFIRTRLTSGYGLVDLLVAKGWSPVRLQSGAPPSDAERAQLTHDTAGMGERIAAWNVAAAVRRRPRFFAAIRANTLAIDTARAVKDSIRAYYRRLAALYPDAKFPPVYFLIGQLSSGGTTDTSGQLIGAEMHGADASTPLDELDTWERGGVGRIDGLPGIVAHELMHIQQAHAAERTDGGSSTTSKPTLLATALEEGCASFMSWIVTGQDPARAAGGSAYGLAHEHDLWVEFQREMNGTDASHWLYQGSNAKDRPADLGYFVGARICWAYYEHAADKRQAIREIFTLPDPTAFLAKSGYAP